MKNKSIIFTLQLIFCSALAFAQQFYPVRNRIEVINLDGTWQLKLDNTKDWRNVKVPGNWEFQGIKKPEYGRDLSNISGIYRQTFNYHEEWKGKEVILRLDGIQNGFTAYINGHEVGKGHSAHTMSQFIITPFLNTGINEISLKVNTHSPYWLFDVCDAWSLTGIKRSVELFSVPKEGSIADVVFTSKVSRNNSADININVKTNGTGNTVAASLLDERYNHVCDLSSTVQNGTASMSCHLVKPKLWTAETPNLYTLRILLYNKKGDKLQMIEDKVGIREVRTENCKILLNNKEIFLRGVCLSENDAIEGGAMTYFERRKQLEQMKAANINFIRTAHYPLDQIFTRLCDEMGFYVCEEIPFASRGDVYLKSDTTVVTELKARAKATIDRDRNCPSIILWSHGNENRIYPCQDSVLLFTKLYDPTRLRCVPQAKGAFLSYIKHPSKYVDVISGHYANDGVLAQATASSQLPVINTEYAHSLGTSFGDLEHKYDIFRKEQKIAGGSVWSFQDQSILTHHFNQQGQVLKGVRIDSLRYMDCYGLNNLPATSKEKGKEGTDGIIYGDGYPQEDYFELAQVYTPVFIYPSFDLGNDNIVVTVENRFNFISLNGYSVHWRLQSLSKTLDEGNVWLSAEANTAEKINIPLKDNMPDDVILAMNVLRPDGSLCYERNITVRHDTDYALLLKKAKGNKPSLTAEWLKNGFLLRTGRPITVSLDNRRKGLWQQYLISPSQLKTEKRHGEYHITCLWQHNNKAQQYIRGDIRLATTKEGTTRIDYTLTPSDSISGKFLDFGLAWRLPTQYTDLAWLGQGPFSQTPDKTAYNNRAIWKLHKNDIRFYGNRADVDLMTIRSPKECLAICTKSKNIHLENIDGHICLTDNIVVGTYGTKFTMPNGIDAKSIGKRSGTIIIKSSADELIKDCFGTWGTVNPEQPYMESYGK